MTKEFKDSSPSLKGIILVTGLVVLLGCLPKNVDSKLKIIGGTGASSYLFYANPAPMQGGEIFCGASRIGRSAVLTAAHCVAKGNNNERIGVVIGKNSIEATNSALKIPVKQLIVHPDYDPESNKNDIALLILEEHPALDEDGGIVQLPRADDDLKPGDLLKVIGFGMQSSHGDVGGKGRDALQEAQVSVITNAACETLYSQHMASKGLGMVPDYKIRNSQICAGYPEKGLIDSCSGDSGGPLFRKAAYNKDGYELIGIVSQGFRSSGCAEKGTAGIYTRVGSFVGWIQQMLEKVKDPVTKLPLHELVGYECHHLSSFNIMNDGLRIGYRYPFSTSVAISSEEYKRLSILPTFGQCDLQKNYGITVAFINNSTPEKSSVFALISDGRGTYLKQSFVVQSYEYDSDKNYASYSPRSKVLYIQAGKEMFIGVTPLVTLPPSGSTLASYQNPIFSYRVWETKEHRYFGQVSIDRQSQLSYELTKANSDTFESDVKVTYFKKNRSLVIHNDSLSQVVTWQLSCPFAFTLRDQKGRELKSHLFESPNRSPEHLVVVRYPGDAAAVIAPRSKVTFEMLGITSDDTAAAGKCMLNNIKKVVIQD